jgi:uncharacterized membrane protein/nitrite reductase/ring-hydroxylating ferredoxin subunit
MKSKANVKSHPLHPILVNFPIAFFTGTLLFEAIGVATGRGDLNHVAYYLEIGGIGFGLLAAVPGFIDFLYTVPPKSSGKKRAAKHGLLNVTVVILFSIALFMRRQPDTSVYLLLVLELVGVILLSIAGWLGGTLVYRNEIGVDVRYAGAGKWKEISVEQGAGPVEIAGSNELKPNQMKLIRFGNKRIVLGRTETGHVAFEDHCTHKGGSLAGGAMICGTVQCPWHGTQFDVNTGQVKAGPGREPINVYPVTESNGKVFLTLANNK